MPFKTLGEVLMTASRGHAGLLSLARKIPSDGAALDAFVTALGTELDEARAAFSPDQLGAARAALKGLREHARLGAPLEGIVVEATADAGKEAATRAVYGEDGWQCPRCGSARVREDHTDRDARTARFIQLRCEACGLSEDGTELTRW